MKVCNGCGKDNDHVRGCCNHPDAEDICDSCYKLDRGKRHNKTHHMALDPRA